MIFVLTDLQLSRCEHLRHQAKHSKNYLMRFIIALQCGYFNHILNDICICDTNSFPNRSKMKFFAYSHENSIIKIILL